MNEDMMNMVQKMSEMMGNKEIPSEIKNILNSMNMNNVGNANSNEETSNESVRSDNNFNDFIGNIDFNTILKAQEIMNSLKNDKQNDYRTNLLLALKPYVRESRKNKVDTYIQLMKMGKIIQGFNNMGGENQNE